MVNDNSSSSSIHSELNEMDSDASSSDGPIFMDCNVTKWDNFCWGCHTECDGEVRCNDCCISYHMDCVTESEYKKYSWKCPECEALADAQFSEAEMFGDNKIEVLLQMAMERIIRHHNDFEVPDDYVRNPLLVKPITLDNIIDDTKNGCYVNSVAFVLDFKWISHNCIVLNNQKKGRTVEKKRLTALRNNAKTLLNRCLDEVSNLKNCVDCYIHQEEQNPIEMVCSKPHLVLWVRFGGHPYWPAKLLKIEKGQKPIEVQFFGDSTGASVAYADCLLYSTSDPNIWCSDRKKEAFFKALVDVGKYIKNAEKKFGPFNFAPPKTQLVPGNLNKYLDDMFPGFHDLSKRPSVSDQTVNQVASSSSSSRQANAENSLESLIGQNPVKQEPNDSNQVNDDLNGSNNSVVTRDGGESSTESSLLEREGGLLQTEIDHLLEQIDTLKRQLREKDEAMEVQAKRFKRRFQEVKSDMMMKMDLIKRKQWCSECQDEMPDQKPTCLTCSLFS